MITASVCGIRDTGERLQALKGHTAPVVSVDFSPHGETLVSGSRDGTIRLWDTQTWGCEKDH